MSKFEDLVPEELWNSFEKQMLGNINDEIDFVRSQWNKAYRRGDDRLITKYESQLTDLRDKRVRTKKTFDDLRESDLPLRELERVMSETSSGE